MLPLFLFLQHFRAQSTPLITRLGNDISYPYCKKHYPVMQGFVVVGVNGGNSVTTNPCLSQELDYAGELLHSSQQIKTQLYVNTGNPGGNTPFWPITNSDSTGSIAPNPYGTCTGSNSTACSWQYGWNRATDDIHNKFIPAATAAGADVLPSDYLWWLDVETKNSWDSGSVEALEKNRAVLEGMVTAFQKNGITVGVYASNYQWQIIIGAVSVNSNLSGIRNWRPGATNLNDAQANCSLNPLTPGGLVIMTQYTTDVDNDYQCP